MTAEHCSISVFRRNIRGTRAAIKQLRLGLERLSTQKEMANEIGVSIRMLRMIENENTSLPMTTIDRLAKALGVHRERLIYSTGSPVAVADTTSFAATVESILDDEDKLYRGMTGTMPKPRWMRAYHIKLRLVRMTWRSLLKRCRTALKRKNAAVRANFGILFENLSASVLK
jgi:transcriptional regulator with XRE-family HTH domain